MGDNVIVMINLDYKSSVVGGGSMKLRLTVHEYLAGEAEGTIQEGTEHPLSFSAICTGHMHHTGLGNITMVGAVSGKASVNLPTPEIGTISEPFTASFAVDEKWSGRGKFTVGTTTYECEVSSAF